MIGKRNLPSHLAKYDVKLRLIQCSCVYRSRIHERTYSLRFLGKEENSEDFCPNYVQEPASVMCFRMFLPKVHCILEVWLLLGCFSIDMHAEYFYSYLQKFSSLKSKGGVMNSCAVLWPLLNAFRSFLQGVNWRMFCTQASSTCIKNVWRPENRSDRCK